MGAERDEGKDEAVLSCGTLVFSCMSSAILNSSTAGTAASTGVSSSATVLDDRCLTWDHIRLIKQAQKLQQHPRTGVSAGGEATAGVGIGIFRGSFRSVRLGAAIWFFDRTDPCRERLARVGGAELNLLIRWRLRASSNSSCNLVVDDGVFPRGVREKTGIMLVVLRSKLATLPISRCNSNSSSAGGEVEDIIGDNTSNDVFFKLCSWI
jgi:hypothetical protein